MGAGCRRAQRQQAPQDGGIHPPRNVLLITIDTLRADHLSCYGYTGIDTPAIDSLAKEGIRFEWAFTPVPITLPSHATIMTGLYPAVHGVVNNGEYRLDASARTLAQILQQQGLTTAAFVGAFVLSRQFGLDQGFEWFDDSLSPDRETGSSEHEAFWLYNERRGEIVTEESIKWLKNKNPDRFFLWVHYFDPHTKYDPPQPFRSRYPDRPYDGEIAYTDHCVGLLLRELAAINRLNDTLIVLVADHGESLGEHRENTHGIFLYDATVRVPLILRYPGLPEGLVYSRPVKTLDILPTVLDLLKIPQPAGLQGLSLLTQMNRSGADPLSDDRIFLETRFPEANFGWSRLEGVRTRKWKYIRAPRLELYDLSADPHELQNVLEQYPEQAQNLGKILHAFLAAAPPEHHASKPVEIDAATRTRLEGLGYIQTVRIIADRPDSPPDPKDMIDTLTLFDQGSEQFSAGQYQAAITSFRHLLRKDSKNILARFLLASALEKTGLLEEALKEFQQVADQDPRFINIHNNLGIIYEKLGKFDQALAEYRMDIKLHPASTLSYNNLGGIYLKNNRYQEAREQFEKLLQLKPDPATQVVAHTNLAIACEMLGQYSLAQQEYQRSLTLDPGYLAAHMGLGNIYLKTNQPEQAIREWQKALEINPQNAEAHFNLGCTFLKLNRLDKAIEHLQEAIQLEPNFWQARMLLDQCRQKSSGTGDPSS